MRGWFEGSEMYTFFSTFFAFVSCFAAGESPKERIVKIGLASNYSVTYNSTINPEYNPIVKAYELAYKQKKHSLKKAGIYGSTRSMVENHQKIKFFKYLAAANGN